MNRFRVPCSDCIWLYLSKQDELILSAQDFPFCLKHFFTSIEPKSIRTVRFKMAKTSFVNIFCNKNRQIQNFWPYNKTFTDQACSVKMVE